jgi:hypothetical protein
MAPDAPSRKTRKQIENQLIEVLRERWREWQTAGEENREIARQRFLGALEAFNGFVLYGKLPGE